MERPLLYYTSEGDTRGYIYSQGKALPQIFVCLNKAEIYEIDKRMQNNVVFGPKVGTDQITNVELQAFMQGYPEILNVSGRKFIKIC